MNKQSRYLGAILVFCWTGFTVTLVSWWIYFGITQIQQISLSLPTEVSSLQKFERMLFWEGLTMIACLIGAGAALLMYLRRQTLEAKKLKNFFAAFTHEIKTPLAGARLNVEVLEEKLEKAQNAQPQLKRVLHDLDRLTLHVENSLFLSDESAGAPIIEPIALGAVLQRKQSSFPSLTIIDKTNNPVLLGDQRIFDAVMANIFNNAIVHGKATTVEITCENQHADKVTLLCKDDGVGFSGDKQKLTKPFERHYTGSGSGIGLYLVRTLIERIKGTVSFPNSANGFAVQIEVPSGR